jgi:S1-C subfamily serine protease
MRSDSRRLFVAPALVAIATASTLVIAPAVLAQDEAGFDEASALLANERNTIDVIERFGPSVVAVNVAIAGLEPPVGGPPPGAGPDDFRRFQDFFGDDEFVARSNGSGFLIEFEDDPYLVTNFHVVEEALEPASSLALEGAEISVTFPADAELEIPVDVIGVNPSFDLALLRVQDESLLPDAPALRLADSDQIAVGQKTIAIGNPFGLASTVTSGIVSAVERFVPTVGQVPVPMIQTDAAINPGNSGGPLLDSTGQLIGINTALINPQGRSFAGLGFAVPSNLLAESLANLELGGVTDVSATRPRLGIAAQSLDFFPDVVLEDFGLPEDGVTVIDVQDGSVADKAGLVGSPGPIDLGDGFEVAAPGDTIIAIDGDPVDSVEDITLKVTYGSDAGDRLDFTIIREGVRMDVQVRLEISRDNAFDNAG